MATILDAILNISISPMMPRWHHSVSMYGHIGEHIYAKTFCADYFFGLHPKSSFGNQTKQCMPRSGPGCSKLTTSLVNEILKFQMLISQTCQYFLLKKCEKLLHCKSFSHFFNKKYQCIWLLSRKTLNELTS